MVSYRPEVKFSFGKKEHCVEVDQIVVKQLSCVL